MPWALSRNAELPARHGTEVEGAGSIAGGLIWLHTDPGQGKKAGGDPGLGREGKPGVLGAPVAVPVGGCSWQSPGTGCSGGSPGPGSSVGSAETKAGGEQKAEGNKGDSCGVAGLAAGGVVSGVC